MLSVPVSDAFAVWVFFFFFQFLEFGFSRDFLDNF